jgi:phosphoglycolate phosphatase
VLTNKPAAPSEKIVAALGIAPLVRWIVGGDSPLGRKPDPAGLLALIARAGAAPERTLLVGDSRIDVATGQRAGVRVCAARYGFGVLDAEALAAAAWTIDAPADLVEVLDRWFADH